MTDDYEDLEAIFNAQSKDRRKRKDRMEAHHAVYSEHESLQGTACFYCGEPGRAKDHYPPLKLAKDYPQAEWILVRSCQRCNSVLGAKMQPSLAHRKEYLLWYIKDKEERRRLKAQSDYLRSIVKGTHTYG